MENKGQGTRSALGLIGSVSDAHRPALYALWMAYGAQGTGIGRQRHTERRTHTQASMLLIMKNKGQLTIKLVSSMWTQVFVIRSSSRFSRGGRPQSKGKERLWE